MVVNNCIFEFARVDGHYQTEVSYVILIINSVKCIGYWLVTYIG